MSQPIAELLLARYTKAFSRLLCERASTFGSLQMHELILTFRRTACVCSAFSSWLPFCTCFVSRVAVSAFAKLLEVLSSALDVAHTLDAQTIQGSVLQ